MRADLVHQDFPLEMLDFINKYSNRGYISTSSYLVLKFSLNQATDENLRGRTNLSEFILWGRKLINFQ